MKTIKRHKNLFILAVIVGVVTSLMIEWTRPDSLVAQYTGVTAPAWFATYDAELEVIDNYFGETAGNLHTVNLASAVVGRHKVLSVTGNGEIWFLPVDSILVTPANATDSIMVMYNGGLFNVSGSDSVIIACDADTWDAGEPLGCPLNSGATPVATHYVVAPSVATASAPYGFPYKLNVHTANHGATAVPMIIGIQVIGGTVTSGRLNFIYWTKGPVTVTEVPFSATADW